ncbi:MAG: LD-carboxypeptidase [Crocinitomicaceae bacterium]|nr:LD-carboxypeptidase [Crocinitomicaceae bacterium]
MIQPPALNPGDLIYITAPAKFMDPQAVLYAKKHLEQNGFKVLISKNCFGNHHYFSGTDEERLLDFQFGIDHPDVRAILCARGGYGCVRLVDRINWANMLREPKWLIGFSDITVFHHRLNKLGVQSIHGSMPINFEKNTEAALTTLINTLQGSWPQFLLPSNQSNKAGIATGNLIGGNLSIVYSMLGTDDQYDFEDSILFLEDVGEHYYQVERMLYAFKKAGVFQKTKGLIIGGISELEDTDPPLGRTIQEMVLDQLEYTRIPVLFGFPGGHIADNRAIIVGKKILLTVSEEETSVIYLN